MILDIRKYGEPILEKKAEEVEKITPELKELILNMKETMKTNKGIGLAAPQVGISQRIIVIDTPDGILGFINPKMIKESKIKIVAEEGCLSLPNIYLKIKRSKSIEVVSLAESGRTITIKAEGIMARVFQHEIDHLEGKLLFDRVSMLQKIKAKKEFKRINKK